MDVQHIIDGLFAALGLFVGIVVKSLHTRVEAIDDKLDDIPGTYARRDDLKDSVGRVYAILERIENKLDRKADKDGV